jgi:hypothetical protein
MMANGKSISTKSSVIDFTAHNRPVYASPLEAARAPQKCSRRKRLCAFLIRHSFWFAWKTSFSPYRKPKTVVNSRNVKRNNF